MLALASEGCAAAEPERVVDDAPANSADETSSINTFALSGGAVVPWKGTVGPSVTLRIGRQFSPEMRAELEFEFKTSEGDIYGHTSAYSWVKNLGGSHDRWSLGGIGGFVIQAGLRHRS